MKVIKDTSFEFGYAVWQVRPPRPSLTVVVKGTFVLTPDAPCELAEEQAPVTGESFWEDDPNQSVRLDGDLAILKPRAECFLAGTCHPPQRPATVSAVSFRVGQVQKRLAVFGDRLWEKGITSGMASPPLPFMSMPLRYERSFGGEGIHANPLGCGLGEALPNVEDPADLVTSPSSRPRPAGAFPIPRTWKSRVKKAGTFDDAWLKTRWPYFPDDFDWGYFNAAPEDQIIDGYWRGDEEIDLVNLHPEHARLNSRLPGLHARCFLVTDGEPFREVPLRLDTISVDADAGRVYCLWRGLTEVESEKLEEVRQIFLLHEPAAEAGSVEACRARYEQKLRELEEEEEGFEAEAPPVEPPGSAVVEPTDSDDDEEDEASAKLFAEIEARLKEAGIKAPDLRQQPATAEPPSIDQIRASFASAGMAMPPELEQILAELAKEGDGATEEEEEATRASPPDPDVRERVEQRLAAGQPLAGEDLTGGDLSGLSFEGVDLTGAILKDSVLEKARFDNAKLEGAVLDGARIGGASFKGASLVQADLTGTTGEDVDFSGAKLVQAIFTEAQLTRARFAEADLTKAELAQAVLPLADFSGAQLNEADLSGTKLPEARFIGASLVDASLEGADATGAVFDEANLEKLRASEGAVFVGASFKKTRAAGSRWGTSRLDQANFSFSVLDRADFSAASLAQVSLAGCELKKARFGEASLQGASLVKANVLEGDFQSADLSDADLRGANLFGCEFWKSRVERARFELANLKRTKLEKNTR